MPSSVGFIGVGNMGARMAQRIIDAGHPVIVCDSNPAALERFRNQAGVAVTSRAADCAGAEAIVVVVATDEQLLSTALGPDGIGDGLTASASPGASSGPSPVLMVMSTVLPETIARVRDALMPRGVRVIDAPVSGGLVGAAEGTLAIMVGGDAADFDSVMPVMRCMGQQIFHCGPTGTGEVTKIINNMVGVTNLYLAAEAYQLALRHGIDLARLAPVLEASSGRTFLSRDIVAARDQYSAWAESPAAFASLADIIRKDLQLASKLAAQVGLDLPVLNGVALGLKGISGEVLERWQAVAR